jgi:hypothetical protein
MQKSKRALIRILSVAQGPIGDLIFGTPRAVHEKFKQASH